MRGEGRAFSSGIDLSVLQEQAAGGELSAPTEEAIASYQAGFAWLSRPDIVSIAAVHGYAIGAGFQLALACDLRVLSDDAIFSMAETTRGLVPDLLGTGTLVGLVGYSRAVELCVTGRRVSAAEAAELGLATVVVPRDELDAAVDDLVAAVSAPLRGAVVETKSLLLQARDRMLHPAEQAAAERQAQVRRFYDLMGRGE